jgi:hypothetical protein
MLLESLFAYWDDAEATETGTWPSTWVLLRHLILGHLELACTHLFLSISSAWRCSCLTRSLDIFSSPLSLASGAGSRWSRP